MTRILFTLAALSLILLAAALLVGLSIGDLYHDPSADTLHWATVHRLTGIAAALAVVLVESVIVTYFIGTSRWCKEVIETYSLDPARGPREQSTQAAGVCRRARRNADDRGASSRWERPPIPPPAARIPRPGPFSSGRGFCRSGRDRLDLFRRLAIHCGQSSDHPADRR